MAASHAAAFSGDGTGISTPCSRWASIIREDDASRSASASVAAHTVHSATMVYGFVAADARCETLRRYCAAIPAPSELMKSAKQYGSPVSAAHAALSGDEPSSQTSGIAGRPGSVFARSAKACPGGRSSSR